MELKLYLRMLQRSWWIAALTALAALNLALINSYFAVPLYRTSARFILSPNPAITGADLIRSFDTLDRRSIVSTYAELLNSTSVYSETITALQLTPAQMLAYTRAAVVLPDANVLELSVSGPDPKMAALLANSLGQRAIDKATGLNQVYTMNFLDGATPPGRPFSPQPIRDASLALVLGLVVGSALAILREQLRVPLAALRRRTLIDGVSSAYTRRHLQRLLEDEIARGRTGVVSLGLVQLDGLQDLFETLPPLVTQRLLQHVTKTLQNELRGNDSIGRWGDTTFAVLLPATPSAAAQRTLARIQQALSAPIEIDQNGETVTLEPHAGVATGQGRQSAQMLVERAETALEKARQNGTSRVPFTDAPEVLEAVPQA